jgi:hypothetical protein
LFHVLGTGQLEQTLNLLANGEIDIKFITEDKETTGNKCKHKASNAGAWRVEPLNGPPQPFSDNHWGSATHDYMLLLSQVPCDAMAIIMYEVRSVTASQKARVSKATIPSHHDSKHAGLGFH